MVSNKVNKSNEKQSPFVGEAATKYVGSDRYPMVITKVKSKHCVVAVEVSDKDYEKFVSNENNIQYLPNEVLEKYLNDSEFNSEYTLRKNGRWMKKHSGLWETGGIYLGSAELYLDPSF